MFKRNKVSDYISKPEEFLKLSKDDISMVTGGFIKDTGSFYLVINTSGMGAVKSKVSYGGNSGMTKQEAYAEAIKLDAIDYSKQP
ncbi:MAG: hypothetical protein RUMPE_01029 [Eubacteriales bacterium SKADARSKE-1]|nr:hypothetical protein [Eubacteriales bacterium SKADARSKE-1]